MSVSFCDPHDVPLLLGKPLCLRDLMGVCTPSSNRLGTGLQYSLKHRSGVVQSFVVGSRNRTTASLVSRRKMRRSALLTILLTPGIHTANHGAISRGRSGTEPRTKCE